MKFAHEFKDALQREGFPPHWVESAIPYGQLKKCIKKVEKELRSFGLDAHTLGLLIPRSPEKDEGCLDIPPVAFKYNFADQEFRPTLTLYIHKIHEEEIAIDATLSHNTKKYLKALAELQADRLRSPGSSEDGGSSSSDGSTDISTVLRRESEVDSPQNETKADVQRIEVPLTFDAEFFGLLKDDVLTLDGIQAREQKALTDEIQALGAEISTLAVPVKSSKTDLDRWREIFNLYLQAGVFFSTNEFDHGSRTSSVALRQLQWFQDRVNQSNIPKSFRLHKSREALDRFTRINMTLLRNLKFQEMNQLAITKILKKFDKRTSLGAKTAFPPLIQSDPFMSEVMAKAVCAGVSNEIIKLVPQLDDYLCPVCCSISFKPVRLTCGHVFCIRCILHMQRTNSKYCPLCRDNVVMTADSANVDKTLLKFLEKYFPRESKAKQRENEIAAGVDLYGEEFARAKCVVM